MARESGPDFTGLTLTQRFSDRDRHPCGCLSLQNGSSYATAGRAATVCSGSYVAS